MPGAINAFLRMKIDNGEALIIEEFHDPYNISCTELKNLLSKPRVYSDRTSVPWNNYIVPTRLEQWRNRRVLFTQLSINKLLSSQEPISAFLKRFLDRPLPLPLNHSSTFV